MEAIQMKSSRCRACGGKGTGCAVCGGAGRVTLRRRVFEDVGDGYDRSFQDLRAHIDHCEQCGWLANDCEERERLIGTFLGLRAAVSLLLKNGSNKA